MGMPGTKQTRYANMRQPQSSQHKALAADITVLGSWQADMRIQIASVLRRRNAAWRVALDWQKQKMPSSDGANRTCEC